MAASPPDEPAEDGPETSPSLLARLSEEFPVELTIPRVVVGITVVGLLLRIAFLDARPAHWDEARVAYWIDYYVDTGNFAYRRIIHGPFVQHVNYWLFQVFGANDFAMRLPVAVVGGLLPLSALLFRNHLRDDETVVLALLLAGNAVLLYYSRFLRSDVLVGAFMFTALGTLVRFYDTRRWRYLYAAGALMALGFASKENAIVYVLTWLGGGLLLLDHALFRPRDYDSGFDYLRNTRLGKLPAALRWLRRAHSKLAGMAPSKPISDLKEPDSRLRGALRYLVHPAGVVVVFLAITVFMYAPRGAGRAGLDVVTASAANPVGLWEAVFSPAKLPGLVSHTLTDSVTQALEWSGHGGVRGDEADLIRFYGQQVADDHREIIFFVEAEYLKWLGGYVRLLWTHARVILVFGLLGFVYERFVDERSRNLLLFAAYGGLASIVGYPLGADVYGPWLAVHMVLPLAIPATVLIAIIYRKGWRAQVDGDTLVAAAAVFLLVLAAATAGMAAVNGVYSGNESDSNNLVQYAQPAGDLGPVLDTMYRIGPDHEGQPDVLLYYGGGKNGTSYVGRQALVKNESQWAPSNSSMDFKPHCGVWFNLLPLPWYFQSAGTSVACERDPSHLRNRVQETPPPMIISMAADSTVPDAALRDAGYVRYERQMRSRGYETEFWIHQDWAPGGT